MLKRTPRDKYQQTERQTDSHAHKYTKRKRTKEIRNYEKHSVRDSEKQNREKRDRTKEREKGTELTEN
jgi:hypothetical protein